LKDFLKKNGIRLAAAVLIVALLAGLGAYLLGGKASPLRNLAGELSAPVDKAASAVVGWYESLYGYLYDYDQLKAENEALRAQLAELQERSRLAEEANEENERLRALLELREKHADFDFESAKIVSWNASNWASSFTISKGEDSGIQLGDCVVTEYGALVGRVIELGSGWATVRTLVDVDMDVGVLVGEMGSAAMLVGEFSLMQRGQAKLTYLPDGASLLEGDTVLTSGKGGAYPQGLLVGTVDQVLSEGGGQSPYGILQPACDLSRLSQVFVIKDFEIVE